jgi:hypothetical protein
VNLCRPDNSKSCAACCGLYNVPDATRSALAQKLEARTRLFQHTQRSADAIQEYQTVVRSREATESLDPAIHVCEFTGFLDPEHRVVGCQLHPSSASNNGIDWRGLCYYGTMACKAFYCPAWTELPHRYRDLVVQAVHDWHLYGLVVTDVDYVLSLFGLIEVAVGAPIRSENVRSARARELLVSMLSWKDSWPFSNSSTRRDNRYHYRGTPGTRDAAGRECLHRVLDCLRFTFDPTADLTGQEALVQRTVEEFVHAYQSVGNGP